MSKIQKMLDAGIPVIVNKSDEIAGTYSFEYMTEDMEEKANIIINGWTVIRAKRNFLLSSCDWTQLPDSPLTNEQRQLWIDYRNTLRSIPQSFSNPEDVIFPDPPQ